MQYQKKAWRLVALAFLLAAIFIPVSSALAHNGEDHGAAATANRDTVIFGIPAESLEQTISTWSVRSAGIAALLLLFLTAIAIVTVEKHESFKKLLFISMATVIVLPTVFFAGSTVYINVISDTGGPVHWHLDYRIFVCGKEVTLAGPTGFLSNKVGTPTFHHHDDDRIHVEGTVIDVDHVNIESFFHTIGGKFTNESFTIPAEEGTKTVTNGDSCPDGTPGVWQSFLFEVPDADQNESRLSELTDPATYVMKPRATIPPGDCIIFQYGAPADIPITTCRFYDIEYKQGRLEVPTAWRAKVLSQ